MTGPSEGRARLSIDVAPELRRRLKVAAASRELTIRDFVEEILRRALDVEEPGVVDASERAAWSRLSAHAFARDWNSKEDQEYDRLA